MSKDIIETVFGRKLERVSLERAELLAIGSILDIYAIRCARHPIQMALRRLIMAPVRSTELYVWGAGTVQQKLQPKWPQKLKICAIRGGRTAETLGVKGIPLGDPGIFASLLVERDIQSTCSVAIIPNHVDWDIVARTDLPKNWRLVSPEQQVRTVLRELSGADLVVSSSLHGIIAADAFGIPAVWLKTQRPLAGDPTHKFLDYASARGSELGQALDLTECISMNEHQLAAHATTCKRDIAEWQSELIQAFPFR